MKTETDDLSSLRWTRPFSAENRCKIPAQMTRMLPNDQPFSSKKHPKTPKNHMKTITNDSFSL
jgi:hypothetical protein